VHTSLPLLPSLLLRLLHHQLLFPSPSSRTTITITSTVVAVTVRMTMMIVVEGAKNEVDDRVGGSGAGDGQF
jgi:hypothetical protein